MKALVFYRLLSYYQIDKSPILHIRIISVCW